MQPTVFSCPHCAAQLRIRDRSHIGRAIDCPDCRRPLHIVADASGRVTAGAVAATQERPLAELRRPAWTRRMRSPLMVLWTSIGLAAALTVWQIVRNEGERAGKGARQPGRSAINSRLAPPVESPAPMPASDPVDLSAHQPISVPVAADPSTVATQPPDPPPDPLSRQPIDVSIATDLPRVDIAAQLQQPILEFTQDRPVEARHLLRLVAEMSAVPVDDSAVDVADWRDRLDRPVTLALKQTNVAELLQAVIRQADLRTEFRDGVIVVLPPDAPRAP